MKLKLARVRYGEVLANIYWSSEVDFKKPLRFIISHHGLPSHPYQLNPAPLHGYIEKGFVMVYPEYIGTWGSYGKNTLESCVKTALDTINFVSKGTAMNLADNTSFSWTVKDITLLGGSFGGSVVLVAGAKSKEVKNIIAIAAPTDYRTHNKSHKEEDLNETWCLIQRGFENLWRLDKKFFIELSLGKIDLNPIDYAEKLENKNILLIHGDKDNSVSVDRSIELFNQIKKGKGKHKLIILKNEGHKGNDIIGGDDIFPRVIDWLEI